MKNSIKFSSEEIREIRMIRTFVIASIILFFGILAIRVFILHGGAL